MRATGGEMQPGCSLRNMGSEIRVPLSFASAIKTVNIKIPDTLNNCNYSP